MPCGCSDCKTASFFDERLAQRELRKYHRAGPRETTKRLIELLRAAGADDTLLDIGCGTGILTFELLGAGFSSATCIDAAPASLAAGRAEATRRGVGERITWTEGDFVELASLVPSADVVTLDRVVCCYPAYRPLLEKAAARSRCYLALVYPRNRWFVRLCATIPWPGRSGCMGEISPESSRMKAVVYAEYGSPDVLHLAELDKPLPADNEVLIRIHAVSINGSDREALIGKPSYARMGGLLRPRHRILGSDIAGRVEAVGKNHTEFQAGDEVFGEIPGYRGGFAEYVCTHGKTLALKPAGLSFEEAAAIPQGGVIALRGIRDNGRVQPGQRVLVNGAGGSAGSFAIQLAKLYGAEVTGVDGTAKLEFMRSLGADHVIDYTREDFTRNGKQYDLILDLIAHRSVFAYQRALRPKGTCFFVGGSAAVLLQILLLGPWIRRARGARNLRLLVVPQNKPDLLAITHLCESGQIVPAIDRRFSLKEVPEAFRYLLEGRAKGKVVICVLDNS